MAERVEGCLQANVFLRVLPWLLLPVGGAEPPASRVWREATMPKVPREAVVLHAPMAPVVGEAHLPGPHLLPGSASSTPCSHASHLAAPQAQADQASPCLRAFAHATLSAVSPAICVGPPSSSSRLCTKATVSEKPSPTPTHKSAPQSWASLPYPARWECLSMALIPVSLLGKCLFTVVLCLSPEGPFPGHRDFICCIPRA